MENKDELEMTPAEEISGEPITESLEPSDEIVNEQPAADEPTESTAVEEGAALLQDDTPAEPGDAPADVPADDAPEKKKGPFIQIPVIISLVIVILALLGYFTFTSFFLREPEGISWSKDYDGITYYFEFKDDGVFKSYVGSVELTGTYEKSSDEEGNYLTVSADAGDFYANEKAAYEITGSRILGDQVLKISYGEGYEAEFTQSKGFESPLELPEGFAPDEQLTGSWCFSYYGYEYCVVTFNADGSMKIDYPLNGVAYNGTYTIENGSVNFTYYVGESIVQPIEYKVDGDVLTFMGMQFVRDGSNATVDEIQYSYE